MQKCPKCGHTNRLGVLFCEKCGTYLRGGSVPGSTKSLDDEEKRDLAPVLTQEPLKATSEAVRGTDMFPDSGSLRLEIEGSPEPITLGVGNREIVLGRRDPATGALPEVDLTPYAGYRMGVSRRHSHIRRADDGYLELFDLGSSNGTFLNGQRLEAHYPYRLHHGDKIGLGQIVLRVYFLKPGAADEKPAELAPMADIPTDIPQVVEPPKAEVVAPPAPAAPASAEPAASPPPAPAEPASAPPAAVPESGKAEEPAAAPPVAPPAAVEPPKPAEPATPESPAAPEPAKDEEPSTAKVEKPSAEAVVPPSSPPAPETPKAETTTTAEASPASDAPAAPPASPPASEEKAAEPEQTPDKKPSGDA